MFILPRDNCCENSEDLLGRDLPVLPPFGRHPPRATTYSGQIGENILKHVSLILLLIILTVTVIKYKVNYFQHPSRNFFPRGLGETVNGGY